MTIVARGEEKTSGYTMVLHGGGRRGFVHQAFHKVTPPRSHRALGAFLIALAA